MDEQELKNKVLEYGKIPSHIAIIMDGNGRWAKSKGLRRVDGHHEGINSVRAIVEACGDIGVKVLTLYTFSKENWQRPKTEIKALWKLLIRTITREVPDLKKNNVQFKTIGIIKDLPLSAREGINYAVRELKKNTGLILNLALSYSSRMEIAEAVQGITKKIIKKEIQIEDIDEQLISDHLSTAGLPDPDLLIRTSGEMRISNFLLWQIAYSEIFVTDTYWPDFRKKEFYNAILSYQQRERRYGMVSEQVSNVDNS